MAFFPLSPPCIAWASPGVAFAVLWPALLAAACFAGCALSDPGGYAALFLVRACIAFLALFAARAFAMALGWIPPEVRWGLESQVEEAIDGLVNRAGPGPDGMRVVGRSVRIRHGGRVSILLEVRERHGVPAEGAEADARRAAFARRILRGDGAAAVFAAVADGGDVGVDVTVRNVG